MTDQSRTSLRQLSRETQLSVGACHEAVRKHVKLYPYKITRVNKLQNPDFPARVRFCNFFLENFEADEELDMLFMSDECWFELNGHVNTQNCRIWGQSHPMSFYKLVYTLKRLEFGLHYLARE
ncbi:hypothetical protein C0J52_20352 [Blattella germanica]|nr:hypothetical protein C0J52_20352 [Blattella germanica]